MGILVGCELVFFDETSTSFIMVKPDHQFLSNNSTILDL